MDVDNLVRMANRIGEFFAAMPDREEAKDGIAQHLRRFWEPRMRRILYAPLDSTPSSGVVARQASVSAGLSCTM